MESLLPTHTSATLCQVLQDTHCREILLHCHDLMVSLISFSCRPRLLRCVFPKALVFSVSHLLNHFLLISQNVPNTAIGHSHFTLYTSGVAGKRGTRWMYLPLRLLIEYLMLKGLPISYSCEVQERAVVDPLSLKAHKSLLLSPHRFPRPLTPSSPHPTPIHTFLFFFLKSWLRIYIPNIS